MNTACLLQSPLQYMHDNAEIINILVLRLNSTLKNNSNCAPQHFYDVFLNSMILGNCRWDACYIFVCTYRTVRFVLEIRPTMCRIFMFRTRWHTTASDFSLALSVVMQQC